MAAATFRIADLIDYEVQLQRDSALPDATVVARDRRLVPTAPAAGTPRPRLIRAWLDALRQSEAGPWPGAAWARRYRLAAVAALVGGAAAGVGTARLLLRYDGSVPINVVPWVFTFVALPLCMLLILTGGQLASHYGGRALRAWAPVYSLVAERLAEWLSAGAEAPPGAPPWWERLHRLHRPLLEGAAWQLLQLFGLMFYAAALAALLYHVTLTDLAFAWSTTLRLDSASVHRLVTIIGAPFHWLLPLPSAEAVQATQYMRLEGRYVWSLPGKRSAGIAASAAWWPFLAGCIATYGFLPRLALWVWARRRTRRYLRRLAFVDHASETLWRRLTAPTAAWRATEPSAAYSAAAIATPVPLARSEALPKTCVVLKWRDVPCSDAAVKELLAHEFGIAAHAVVTSSGTRQDDAALLTALSTTAVPRTVVVVADVWELPGEALDKLLRSARSTYGADTTCLYAPVITTSTQAAPRLATRDESQHWRAQIHASRQPYTGLLRDYGGPDAPP